MWHRASQEIREGRGSVMTTADGVPSWVPDAWLIDLIKGVREYERREILDIPIAPYEPTPGRVPTIGEGEPWHRSSV